MVIFKIISISFTQYKFVTYLTTIVHSFKQTICLFFSVFVDQELYPHCPMLVLNVARPSQMPMI
jgi:hypothetical protein